MSMARSVPSIFELAVTFDPCESDGRKVRKIAICLTILGLICFANNARAVTITMGADVATAMAQVNTLYASDSMGRPVVLTQTGMTAPNGGTFTEFGVPSV